MLGGKGRLGGVCGDFDWCFNFMVLVKSRNCVESS